MVKLPIFPYTGLFPFKMITIIISWHMPSYTLVENLLASVLCIHSFSAHYVAL